MRKCRIGDIRIDQFAQHVARAGAGHGELCSLLRNRNHLHVDLELPARCRAAGDQAAPAAQRLDALHEDLAADMLDYHVDTLATG